MRERGIIMGAESVQLMLEDDGAPAVVLSLTGEDDAKVSHATADKVDWLVACVRTQREPMLVPHTTRDPAKRAWLTEHAAREALVDVPGGRWIGDLVKVERMPALSVQNFWETDYMPIVGRHDPDLKSLVESLPRLVEAR